MTAADWTFYCATQFFNWLGPALHIVGSCVAVWAFQKSRKSGYLLMAVYFGLVIFIPLVVPHINRAIRAHHEADSSEQQRQKLDQAFNEAVRKVTGDENWHPHPYSISWHLNLDTVLLVTGLWLLARREPSNTSAQPANGLSQQIMSIGIPATEKPDEWVTVPQDLKRCVRCNASIPEQATTCPKCGWTQPA